MKKSDGQMAGFVANKKASPRGLPCPEQNKSGGPCRMQPIASGFCRWHDPDRKTFHRARQSLRAMKKQMPMEWTVERDLTPERAQRLGTYANEQAKDLFDQLQKACESFTAQLRERNGSFWPQ